MAVTARDGIRYGFRLVGYFGVVGVVAAVLLSLGSSTMASARAVTAFGGASTNWGQFVLGALVAFVGGVTLSAASAGMLYKLVADGTERGSGTGGVR